MTYARHGLGCAQATNGKIYAIAGYSGSFLDYNEEYDPVANTWATRAPLYAAMHGVSVVAANNGKVYVIGGTTPGDGYSGQSRVDAYDPGHQQLVHRGANERRAVECSGSLGK